MNSDGGSKLVTRTSKSLKRKKYLVVFSDSSQYGFWRIIGMFLHRPNFLKLINVDIYRYTRVNTGTNFDITPIVLFD